MILCYVELHNKNKVAVVYQKVYNSDMGDFMNKLVEWSFEKAKQLKEARNIELERVAVMIEEVEYIDIRDIPSRPHQKMFILDYDDYIVCVPFVEDDTKIFIKTAYKNRKTNKLIKG